MKKNYSRPELEFGIVNSSDVITTSKFTYTTGSGAGDIISIEDLMGL